MRCPSKSLPPQPSIPQALPCWILAQGDSPLSQPCPWCSLSPPPGGGAATRPPPELWQVPKGWFLVLAWDQTWDANRATRGALSVGQSQRRDVACVAYRSPASLLG